MKSSPSRWVTGLIDFTIAAVLVALALRFAVDVITSILPQLAIVAVIVVVITAGISYARYRRSRW